MKLRTAAVACIIHTSCAGPEPHDAHDADTTEARVWVTSSFAKFSPEDAPPRDARSAIALSAARNEAESFQIHVRAGAAALQALEVRFLDDTSHFASVSREVYAPIVTPTAAWGRKGRVPDALVPSATAPQLAPQTTQSMWIDVFVPEATPPGDYALTAEVAARGAVLARVPVKLRVRAFALPSTASLASAFFMSPLGSCNAAFGSYEACGKWPGANENPDRGVERSHVEAARFLLARRISLANVIYAGSQLEGWPHFDATYGALLDGSTDTRLRGARLTSLELVGKPDRDLLAQFFAHARERGFAARTFYYRCDEPPRGCSFADAEREGAFVHRAAPELRWLVTGRAETLAAQPMQRDVNTLVANMADLPLPGAANREIYDAFARRKNGALWWYQDCSQHGCGVRATEATLVPSYAVDASGVQNRVAQWLAFVYGVSGELYYGIDHAWAHDPWQSALDHGGNGDGTLMYPDPNKTGAIFSSMRLEHIRDGFEDYEYLHLLAARDPAKAMQLAKTFARSVTDFGDEQQLQNTRNALAEAIEAP